MFLFDQLIIVVSNTPSPPTSKNLPQNVFQNVCTMESPSPLIPNPAARWLILVPVSLVTGRSDQIWPPGHKIAHVTNIIKSPPKSRPAAPSPGCSSPNPNTQHLIVLYYTLATRNQPPSCKWRAIPYPPPPQQNYIKFSHGKMTLHFTQPAV
jgi:hypothetical protein